ncbi:MAG: YtxH domain-containing protein [Bacteroidota bacterium]
MKNPFVKDRNNALIAGIIIGSVAAAAVTYLFVADRGAAMRNELCDSFTRLHDKIFGGPESEEEEDHHQDYMKKPHRAPKTDREALLKDQILTDSAAAQGEE